MRCHLCDTELDGIVMGGISGTFNGRRYAFCNWCDMNLQDILKVMKQ